MQKPEIHVSPDPTTLTHEAAQRIIAAAKFAYSQNRNVSLVLSGGSTPKALFELLASDEYKNQLDWSRVEIYFGDERTVPPDHKDSNYGMAKAALLDHVPLKPEHIHRMKGEIAPEEAAIEYGRLLKAKFPDYGPDVILLGMGDDGHTASLFPGTTALHETHHRCVANYVAKLNTWRITMTYPFINSADKVMILATGANKADRITEVLESPVDIDKLPIQGIAPKGQLTWLIDAAAAGMNE